MFAPFLPTGQLAPAMAERGSGAIVNSGYTGLRGSAGSAVTRARSRPNAPRSTPEEVAAAVTFLASDNAANIHGTVLSVDGGWSAV